MDAAKMLTAYSSSIGILASSIFTGSTVGA
jgi:hypothetical protein